MLPNPRELASKLRTLGPWLQGLRPRFLALPPRRRKGLMAGSLAALLAFFLWLAWPSGHDRRAHKGSGKSDRNTSATYRGSGSPIGGSDEEADRGAGTAARETGGRTGGEKGGWWYQGSSQPPPQKQKAAGGKPKAAPKDDGSDRWWYPDKEKSKAEQKPKSKESPVGAGSESRAAPPEPADDETAESSPESDTGNWWKN
jgi:hypothetical protein